MVSSNARTSSAGSPPPPPLPPPPLTPPPPRARRHKLQIPPLDNIESVSTYRLGGHHPVNVGDIIQQRFRIIHKLGNGGFALVWLARDLEHQRYVALKVLRADAPDHEVNILKHIQTADIKTIRIAKLHETFIIWGPNGPHQCLVLEVGGPSLKNLALNCKQPDLSFLRSASQKLAQGLAALHSIGVCHGDLTDSNVLFEIRDFHQWTESQIYERFGTPKTAPLFQLNGSPAPPSAPSHVVSALEYSQLEIDQLSSNIMIVDFGEAFLESNVPAGLGTPAAFYAPELLFGYPPSYAADLWALGCLIFQMHIFHTLLPTAFGTVLEALALAIETVGALPKEWQDLCHAEGNPMQGVVNHDQDHYWFDGRVERTRLLGSQILKKMPDLSHEQHAMFAELLEKILVFEPSSRLSAEAVARHAWFKAH